MGDGGGGRLGGTRSTLSVKWEGPNREINLGWKKPRATYSKNGETVGGKNREE